MRSTSVAVVAPADRQRAIATLTLAFVSDPVVRWVYPDAEQYVESWPRFVDAFGGRAFESGTADRVEDFAAVALWLPPGVAPDEEAMLRHLYVGTNDSVRRDIDLVLGQMDSFHPLSSIGICR